MTCTRVPSTSLTSPASGTFGIASVSRTAAVRSMRRCSSGVQEDMAAEASGRSSHLEDLRERGAVAARVGGDDPQLHGEPARAADQLVARLERQLARSGTRAERALRQRDLV